MEVMINIGITVVTFLLMEAVAWLSHKYLMHGVLWFFHEDHHQHNTNIKPFERNDFFFLLFAAPGVSLIFYGVETFSTSFWIGLGIAIYGTAYFLIHDVFIHRRLKWLRNIDSSYFRGTKLTSFFLKSISSRLSLKGLSLSKTISLLFGP